MKDDDILKVARECFFATTFGFDEPVITFANRIAAMQREKDAGICDEYAASLDNDYNRKMRHPSIAELQEPYFECAAAIREQSDE